MIGTILAQMDPVKTYTSKELADIIGTTPRVITRVLNRACKHGLVDKIQTENKSDRVFKSRQLMLEL
ncbi:hypothetical protein B9G39_21720 [Zooshikella ganghwensis]|uniref:MarR family transcriptional regulator n=1 Tax=Zooshikella ganghwensis TaxID=202772 RepID=A0A4P9VT52_9GAMM|nr:hypothetical protein B9G39_21720 [Zooshikella ganghwensis]